MKDTKLIEVLRCFDTKMVKKLYDYVDSPFFSKTERSVDLLKYLRPFFPALDNPKLDKEIVYPHIFNDEIFNNLRFNRICFEAMDMVEDFMRHYFLANFDTHVNKPIFDFYLKHGLEKPFDAIYKSIDYEIEKMHLRNEQYLFQKWLLSAALSSKEYTFQSRESRHAFSKMLHSLDEFYLAKRLSFICANNANQLIFNTESQDLLEDALIQYIEKTASHQKNIAVKILYHVHLMQKGINPREQFDIIFGLSKSNGHNLETTERLNIYTWLQNFCIAQINREGNTKYEDILFQLYQSQLIDNLMFDSNGNIPVPNFKNIVQLGLRLQKVEWVKNFIDTQLENILLEKREDVKNYVLAIYNFYVKNFPATLKILNNTEPVDIFFKIDMRRLLIKTYYETEEYDLCLSVLNSFRVFIHRDNVLAETHKNTNTHFANMLIKIIQASKVNRLQKLLIDITLLKSIAERKWLIEKIEEKKTCLG